MSMDEKATICAKVADFGLAQYAAPKLGEMLKTFIWLAPEVFDKNSESYDERSDVFLFLSTKKKLYL